MLKIKVTAAEKEILEFTALKNGYESAAQMIEEHAKKVASDNLASALRGANEILKREHANRKKVLENDKKNEFIRDEKNTEHTDESKHITSHETD